MNVAGDEHLTWSPDGTRIAFESDRDGDWEIYTMGPDGRDMRQLTPNDEFNWFSFWSL